LAGGINTFGYVGENPLGYSDPYGLLERCARGLGDKNKPAMSPSGTPLRHDFLVIDGDVYSFQAGDNMLWSDGFIDDDELTDNEMCETVNDDKEFDEAAKQAIVEIGSPNYNVYAYPFTTPHMLGARNCQTWADDVINRTTEILEAKKAKK